MTHSSASPRPGRSWWRALAGVALFALAYAIANRFQLTIGVLYRWAANDPRERLVRTLFCSRRRRWSCSARCGCCRGAGRSSCWRWLSSRSSSTSATDRRSATRSTPGGWLDVDEARQAGQAAGEFTGPLASGRWCRRSRRRAVRLRASIPAPARCRPPLQRGAAIAGLVLLLLPNSRARWAAGRRPVAAERNLYTFGYTLLTATATAAARRGRA